MKNAKFQNKKYSLGDLFSFIVRNFLCLVLVTGLGFAFGTITKKTTSYNVYSANGGMEVTSKTVEQKTIQNTASQFSSILKSTDFLQKCSDKLVSEGIHNSDGSAIAWKTLFDGTDVSSQISQANNCLLILSFKSREDDQPIRIVNSLLSCASQYLLQYYPNLSFSIAAPASSLNVTVISNSKFPLVFSLLALVMGFVCFVLIDLASDFIFDGDDLDFCAEKIIVENKAGPFLTGEAWSRSILNKKTIFLVSFSAEKTTNDFVSLLQKRFRGEILTPHDPSLVKNTDEALVVVLFERGYSTFENLSEVKSFLKLPDYAFFIKKFSILYFLHPFGISILKHRNQAVKKDCQSE
jgi:capsular polysaccharide biosynthesis protein